MALTLKKRFQKRFFGYYLIIFLTIFLKPLIGFIALLVSLKVKFESLLEFYQYGCVFKKRIKRR